MIEYSSMTVIRILNLNTFQINQEMIYDNNGISGIFARYPIVYHMINRFLTKLHFTGYRHHVLCLTLDNCDNKWIEKYSGNKCRVINIFLNIIVVIHYRAETISLTLKFSKSLFHVWFPPNIKQWLRQHRTIYFAPNGTITFFEN